MLNAGYQYTLPIPQPNNPPRNAALIFGEKMTNHEYRKKPVVIKAWQLTSANFNAGVPDFIDEDKVNIFDRFSGDLYAEIETL